MGTLTGSDVMKQAHCAHKLATSCRLTATDACCACQDLRPHASSYWTYVDGRGMVLTGVRWERYCYFCRRFWENRIRATDPPMLASETRVPHIPDQDEFLRRWTEYHRGFSVEYVPRNRVDGDGDTSVRNGQRDRNSQSLEELEEVAVPVVQERSWRDTSPGRLPLFPDNPRCEVITRWQRPAAAVQNGAQHVSLEDTLDDLMDAADQEQSNRAAYLHTLRPTNAEAARQLPGSARATQGENPASEHAPRPAATAIASMTVPVDTSRVSAAASRTVPLEIGTAMDQGMDQLPLVEQRTAVLSNLIDISHHTSRLHRERRELMQELGEIRQRAQGLLDQASRPTSNSPHQRDDVESEDAANETASIDDVGPSHGPQSSAAEADVDSSAEVLRLYNRAEAIVRDLELISARISDAAAQPDAILLSNRRAERRRTRRPPFETREEVERQGTDYVSPLTTMFTRAYERFAVAEEVRAQDRASQHLDLSSTSAAPTVAPPTVPLDARPTRTLDDPRVERPPPMTDAQMTVKLECKICLQQIADTAVLPCGHLVMCSFCADAWAQSRATGDRSLVVGAVRCPVCRRKVRRKVRIYTS